MNQKTTHDLFFISLLIVNIAILFAAFAWLADLSKELNIFQLVVAIGLIIYAFYSTRMWFLLYTANQKMREKEQDDQFRLNLQKELNADAENRRKIEKERKKIDDLFRLIELAKDKTEKTIDKTKTKVDGNVKTPKNNIISTKNDKVDKELLTNFVTHYSKIIDCQQTQSTDNETTQTESEQTSSAGTPSA